MSTVVTFSFPQRIIGLNTNFTKFQWDFVHFLRPANETFQMFISNYILATSAKVIWDLLHSDLCYWKQQELPKSVNRKEFGVFSLKLRSKICTPCQLNQSFERLHLERSDSIRLVTADTQVFISISHIFQSNKIVMKSILWHICL